MRFLLGGLAVVSSLVLASCVSPTSVIEIPPCADRVEATGQAFRTSPTRFELDHTLEPPLAKSIITFQAGKDIRTVELVSNQPEPVRFFVGRVACVAGAVLFTAGTQARAAGAVRFEPNELVEVVGSASLMTVGAAAVLTGWRPSVRFTSFADACPEPAR